MSTRKGVSAEEKRTRMLQLFYEKKEFFQLKDLEKIAPKEKGITMQSVKDVVQALVDDGLVDTDKIGTSVYFWAYPSKARIEKEKRLKEAKERLASAKQRLLEVKKKLNEEKVGKEASQELSNVMDRIEDLKKKQSNLSAEITKYQEDDPEIWSKMKLETKKSKEAVNRWTDNIFSIKSWCTKKYPVEEKMLDKEFGIPDDLDYMD